MSTKDIDTKDAGALVRDIIVKQLNVDAAKVGDEATFAELGADSLDLVELIMELEERFGIEISEQDQMKIKQVKDAIDYVTEHTA